MKKILAFLLVMVFAFVLVGCGEDDPATDGEGGTKVVERIRLSAAKRSITVGETTTVTATIEPTGVTTTLTWTTETPDIISVTDDGQVTGVANGVGRVKATAENNVSATLPIQVSAQTSDYPDLQGYTIRIAQAETALGNYDPFLDEYTQLNKAAKQQAWEEIEELFNCNIEVVAYPSSADWGPSRWNYITDQAEKQVSDYDFLTVPDAQIGRFVEANALIDLTNFYTKYGNDLMDPTFITSGSYKGKLYSFVDGEAGIYNVMYYNVGLLQQLQTVNSALEEPAKIFNDGNWTFETFEQYCKDVQTAMETLFGAKTDDNNYYAVAGNATYYWVGMVNASGEVIANVETKRPNLTSDAGQAAIDVFKELFQTGALDPNKQVDENVALWKSQKALFNTGDLWFVGDESRWGKQMWGEDTKYGYVPFPRYDGVSAEDFRLGLTGTATWVMPIGRDYSGYGSECTAENIYYALTALNQLTDKYYKESGDYDEQTARQTTAERYTHTSESVKAMMGIMTNIKNISIFEPLGESGNALMSTYSGEISSRMYDYINDVYHSWAEAMTPVHTSLQNALSTAY